MMNSSRNTAIWRKQSRAHGNENQLKDGEHTGAKPGRVLWGPGKIKSPK